MGQGDKSTDGFSFLYVGDIDISFDETTGSTSSHDLEKYEVFTIEERVPRSISHSPNEIPKVDPMLEEEKDSFHWPSHFEGSLNTNDKKIQEALSTLQDTSALVSQLTWRDDSMESQTSNGVIEKI